MQKTHHIIHILTGLEYGGAEGVVYDLCRFINKNKFRSTVVSLSDNIDRLKDFEANSISTIPLAVNIKNPISLIKKLLHVYKYIKVNNVQIIHAHLFWSMVFAVILKLMSPSLKIIFTFHNTIDSFKGYRKLIIFLTKYFRNVDVIFAESDKSYICTKVIYKIPNGTNTVIRKNLSKYSVFTFVGIARLRYQKNFQALPQIIHKVKQRIDIPFQVLIAGDGDMETTIHSKIEKFQLQNTIKLLGLIRNTSELYTQSHALLMPSLWEGMPITLLEAGLYELPCIVTPVGSIPEYFDSTMLYLCEVDKFEDAIIEVITNYKSAQDKAKKLKTIVEENFLVEKMAKKHENIYLELLS